MLVLSSLLTILFCHLHIVSGKDIVELQLGVTSSNYIATCDSYKYFKVKFTSPCKDLQIDLQISTGQADIYASKSSNSLPVYPTSDTLTWASYSTDTKESLLISHWDPEFSVGTFYVAVYADCWSSSTVSATFTIKASEVTSEDADLYINPALGHNKLVYANEHTYLQFCIPYDCASITATPSYLNLADLSNNIKYPSTYIWPDLVLSRTNRYPQVKGNVFHGWSSHVSTSASDPSARDNNGYLSGSYYLAMFGWCTYDPYCVDASDCGPCDNYGVNGTLFNITLNVTILSSSECVSQVIEREDDNTYTLTDGIPYSGSLKCHENQYFKIAVPDPCYNLKINTYNNSGDPCCTSTDLYVGKWPNVRPSSDHLVWSNFFWNDKNLTIYAWDPAFFGGYHCGPDGFSLCYYYIGLHGWCLDTSDYTTDITYTLDVTLHRAHAIFDLPQKNQTIASGESKYYKFCVADAKDVLATLTSFQEECQSSSDPYTWLNMVISRTDTTPSMSGLVWRMIRSHEYRNYIPLRATLPQFRTGAYYLAVSGSCDSTCSSTADACSCGACSKLTNGEYSLSVGYNTTEDSTASCDCEESTTTSSSCSSQNLNNGQIAGLVIGLFFENIVVVVLVIFFCWACAPSKGKYEGTLDHVENPAVARD